MLLVFLPAAAAPAPPEPKPQSTDAASVVPAAAENDIVSPAATVDESGERLLMCSNYGGANWTTRNSRSLQTIRTCNLTLSGEGVAYISATATGFLPRDEAGWAGRFQLAVGSSPQTLQPDARTERVLYLPNAPDLPADPDSQTSKTMAATLLIPLTAGSYTFGLLGQADFGEARLSNPAISVLFVARTAADVATCGQSVETWTAAATGNFQSIASCAVNSPQDGWAFVSATSTIGSSTQSYEARFRIGSDLTGVAQSDRYVNVYPSLLVTGGENIESSALVPVKAGANTFHFLGYRYAGSGTLSARDASLSVIYFPSGSLSMYACGAAGANLVTVSQTAFTPVAGCQLNVPRNTVAFVDASTSASIGVPLNGPAQEYEGRARIGVDSTEGLAESERRFTVDSEPDPSMGGIPEGDGSDRPVATSIVVPLARGSHTISFNVRRAVGTQPVRMYAPTLTVLVAGPRDTRLLPSIAR